MRRYSPRSYSRSGSYGSERAREHIRQANQLSRELGGTDKDVKAYFFGLSASEQAPILDEYERLHGSSAREYAENTLPRWQRGRVHMSGMVAERLFRLLPRYMPISQKYKLTESLWRHVAPASSRALYVNPNASPDEVISVVRGYLEQDVLEYKIPETMERRFDWLSQGDVDVKQQLLNFLRQKERELASESLRLNMPILTEHMRNAENNHAQHFSHDLQIGNTKIAITFTDRVDGITETAPPVPKSLHRNSSDGGGLWWLWLAAGLIVLWVLSQI